MFIAVHQYICGISRYAAQPTIKQQYRSKGFDLRYLILPEELMPGDYNHDDICQNEAGA